jgi:hypothetical protein
MILFKVLTKNVVKDGASWVQKLPQIAGDAFYKITACVITSFAHMGSGNAQVLSDFYL